MRALFKIILESVVIRVRVRVRESVVILRETKQRIACSKPVNLDDYGLLC